METSNVSRWGLAILGILAIILGALAIVYPTIFFGAVIWVLGIFLFVIGIFDIVLCFGDKKEGNRHWWVRLITGILYIIIGVLFVWNPYLGGLALILVLAIFALVTGLMLIISYIALRNEDIPGKNAMILEGVLLLILGILFISSTLFLGIAVLTVVWLIGFLLIFYGISSLVASFTG